MRSGGPIGAAPVALWMEKHWQHATSLTGGPIGGGGGRGSGGVGGVDGGGGVGGGAEAAAATGSESSAAAAWAAAARAAAGCRRGYRLRTRRGTMRGVGRPAVA